MQRKLTRGTPDEENYRDFRAYIKHYPPNTALGLSRQRAGMLKDSLIREPDEVMDRLQDPEVCGVPLKDQGMRLPQLNTIPYQKLGRYVVTAEQVELIFRMVRKARRSLTGRIGRTREGTR